MAEHKTKNKTDSKSSAADRKTKENGFQKMPAVPLVTGVYEYSEDQLSEDLFQAIRNNDPEKVRVCLDKKADINENSIWGTSPLVNAVRENDYRICKMLIEAGADVNSRTALWNGTPLHDAVHFNHKHICRLLLEHGADVNARDKQEATPLIIAVLKGRIGICKLLVEHGADLNAFYIYIQPGSRAVFELSILMCAAGRGYENIVDYLLSVGADPSVRIAGRTAARSHATTDSMIANLERYEKIWLENRFYRMESLIKRIQLGFKKFADAAPRIRKHVENCSPEKIFEIYRGL